MLAPGAALLAATIFVPAVVLVIRSVEGGRSAGTSTFVEVRQLTLLLRSVRLAGMGAVAALLLSLPAAYAVGRIGSLSRIPAVAALLAMPLLLPPMVYVFGWQRLGLECLPGEALCLWVWASWGWPIPAALIGAAWARRGQSAYEAALLVTGRAQAFIRAALPLLTMQAAIAVLILFVLFLGEYGVPHANGLVVLATELLGWASQSGKPADVLIPALPMVLVSAAGLLGLAIMLRRTPEAEPELGTTSPTRRWPSIIVAATVALTVGVPLGSLAVRFAAHRVMAEAWRTYRGELTASLGVAAVAGITVVLMGASVALSRRWLRWALPAAILWGVLPAALAGEAILATYRPIRPVYYHWPLLAVGYVARYGWIGCATAWLARSSVAPDLVRQARSDGAGDMGIAIRLGYRPNVAMLLCAAAVVSALSLSDAVLGTMLTVPGIGPVSSILLEKFHRLEDQMLVALSLWLVVGAVPAALLAWLALKSRRRSGFVRTSAVALAVLGLGGGCSPPPLSDNGVIAVVGGVGLGPGEFSYPRAITVSSTGSVFVVDKAARVQRFTSKGEYELEWRMPQKQAGKPVGLTVHPDGRIFVADTHYHRVVVYDNEGNELARFGELGNGDGQFQLPTDVAVDHSGFIYVSEYNGNDRVTKWTLDLTFVEQVTPELIEGEPLVRPAGIDIDEEDTLWIADACNHRIIRMTLDGKVLTVFGKRGTEPSQLRYPYDLTAMPDGTIMVCEYGNSRLQWFDKQGRSVAVWGSPGRAIGELWSPWGATVGPDGRLYVVDSLNSRIQIVDW